MSSIRLGLRCSVRRLSRSHPLTQFCGAVLTEFVDILDMFNIFETFLPQLLSYPNPNDPLNGEAAALLMRHPAEYEAKVKGELDSSPRSGARF